MRWISNRELCTLVEPSGGANVRIERLAGEIKTLRETIDGRLNLHDRDISSLKSRMIESEAFRVEMRQRWDHFDGVQQAEKEATDVRHQDNIDALNKLSTRIALGMLIVAALGLIFTAAGIAIAYQAGKNHAQLHLSINPQQTAQYNAKEE